MVFQHASLEGEISYFRYFRKYHKMHLGLTIPAFDEQTERPLSAPRVAYANVRSIARDGHQTPQNRFCRD